MMMVLVALISVVLNGSKIILWQKEKSLRGSLLLDATNVKVAQGMVLASIIMCAMAGFLWVISPWNTTAFALTPLAIHNLLCRTSNLEICEYGIVTRGRLVPWKQIEAYEVREGNNSDTLLLRVPRGSIFSISVTGTVTYPFVPRQLTASVIKLLKERIG